MIEDSMGRIMTEVVVTRRGQTTIPIEIRRKYHITEGTRLEVLESTEGIILKKKVGTFDLIGSGRVDSKAAFELLDKMREEDDR